MMEYEAELSLKHPFCVTQSGSEWSLSPKFEILCSAQNDKRKPREG